MIYLGADHAGYELKEFLKKHLDKKKLKYKDLGALKKVQGDDYPDYAFKVAKKVAKEKAKGILVCGTGVGVCMAANRIKGARAALVHDAKYAKATLKKRQSRDSSGTVRDSSGTKRGLKGLKTTKTVKKGVSKKLVDKRKKSS